MDAAQPNESVAMQHCVDILTGGYVQSYIDFFFLVNSGVGEEPESAPVPTLSPSAAGVAGSPDQATRVQQPGVDGGTDLTLVSDRLVAADKARRSGDPIAVFENYEALASYFFDLGNARTCVHFLNKCLVLAQHVGDKSLEKKATADLANALATLPGETGKAIMLHERQLELARETDDAAAVSNAYEALKVVYRKRAEELEQAGDLAGAVDHLEKLLRVATDSQDAECRARANFFLGKTVTALAKPERAVAALLQTLEFARSSKDIRMQGEACAAVADAYLLIDSKRQKAVEFLQETRKIAKQNGDDRVQAHASCMLGSVYTKSREFGQAVRFYEQNFEIMRKQKALPNIARARVLLGLAHKNARSDEFRGLVRRGDISTILAWKTHTD